MEITSEVIENKSDVFFVEIIGVFFDANSRMNRLAGDKKKMPSGETRYEHKIIEMRLD